MTVNISFFGTSLTVVGSATFPNGFTVTQFSDDADPMDSPETLIAESAGAVNGDHVTWSKFNPIEFSINVIPGSTDDINLQTLFEANRTAKGKNVARDVITLSGAYADGSIINLSDGICATANLVKSGTSAGRFKTKRYVFRMGNMITA